MVEFKWDEIHWEIPLRFNVSKFGCDTPLIKHQEQVTKAVLSCYQRRDLVQACQDLWSHNTDGKAADNDPEKAALTEEDGKSKAILTMSLSKELLVHVQSYDKAFAAWKVIINRFPRKSLMNSLTLLTGSVTTEDFEKLKTFSFRVCQVDEDLKLLDAACMDHKEAKAILSCLLRRIGNVFAPIDAVLHNWTMTT